MVYTYSPTTWEVEAGVSVWVRGQPGLQSSRMVRVKQRSPNLKKQKRQTFMQFWLVSGLFCGQGRPWAPTLLPLSLKKMFLKIYFICLGILPACVYAPHVLDPMGPRSQKRVMDSLELDMHMAVSLCVRAGNWVCVLCGSAHAFNCWATSQPSTTLELQAWTATLSSS